MAPRTAADHRVPGPASALDARPRPAINLEMDQAAIQEYFRRP
jgi:hypothetical protein